MWVRLWVEGSRREPLWAVQRQETLAVVAPAGHGAVVDDDPAAPASAPRRSDRITLTDAKAHHLFRGRRAVSPRRPLGLVLIVLLAVIALVLWISTRT